jgi:putative endonuclease
MHQYVVYVLESGTSGLWYVGFTESLERRLLEHNSGKSKFTSGHLPWKLIYSEVIEGREEARKREKYLKSAAGKRYIAKQLGL